MENNNYRTECEFIIFWIVLGYLHTFKKIETGAFVQHNVQ